MEIFARSTFCWRANVRRRSSGPSNPSTSTISNGSSLPRLFAISSVNAVASVISSSRRGAGATGHQLREFGPRGLKIDGFGRAARRQRPRGALQRSAAKLRATRRNLLHFGKLAVAMEDEVAARSQRLSDPFANRARQSPHRHIVAHQGSGESDKATNHLSDHNG